MFVAHRYLRAFVFGFVSVGMLVPAWATQPCDCGDGGSCAKKAAPPCCSGTSCCAEKSCCTRSVGLSETPTESCQVGCPCCTESPEPAAPAPHLANKVDLDHAAIAFAALPAIVVPAATTTYLVLQSGDPSGHPSLRLHALYRVWLN